MKKQRELMKKGCQDEERIKPERDFRSVWNADVQAHSSTLQRRVWGGEQRKEQMRYEMKRWMKHGSLGKDGGGQKVQNETENKQ